MRGELRRAPQKVTTQWYSYFDAGTCAYLTSHINGTSKTFRQLTNKRKAKTGADGEIVLLRERREQSVFQEVSADASPSVGDLQQNVFSKFDP